MTVWHERGSTRSGCWEDISRVAQCLSAAGGGRWRRGHLASSTRTGLCSLGRDTGQFFFPRLDFGTSAALWARGMSVRVGAFSELVLASTSPARQALMTGLGLPYRAEAPGVDEVVAPGTPAQQAVAILAERKARAVAKRSPLALVIGADQLGSIDGDHLGKPNDEADALRALQRLAGRTHSLFTAVTVVGPGFLVTEVDAARLTMAPIAEGELRSYLATGEWQGCAGAYRIEGRGQALFSQVDGDRTAIQGLPMARVVRLLREAGVPFF
jgi:septum formation protein